MTRILITNARIVTLAGPAGARRGPALRDLRVIDKGWMLIERGRVREVHPGDAGDRTEAEETDVIDAGGSVVMPAFIDCHTHACWAGSRVDEWSKRLAGADYLEILRAGGGIMSTVRAVRDTPEPSLIGLLMRRLSGMLSLGTGTVEVKSGYGLDTESELKMLRVIHAASQLSPQTIIGSFLGAHAIEPGRPGHVEQIIQETLPAVAAEFPGIVCDAFCEQGAWSLDDTVRYFNAARDLGCPIRVHADQFNSLGATRLAIELGAVSVDHLEASTPSDLEQLAGSSTFGVMLPACGFHLDGRYAPARRFLDAGGALALATNFNPGSAPTPSMPFVVALACRKLGLTPAEAITCAIWNPACLLGLDDRLGSIEPGKIANIQILDAHDERELGNEFATAGPLIIILGGQIVQARAVEREEISAQDGEEDEEEGEHEDEDESIG